MSKNVGNSLNRNPNRSSKWGKKEEEEKRSVETGTILPITRSIVSIYQNCVTVNMRAVPFMRAHRRNISSTSCRDIETWSCRLCWGGENRERERERRRVAAETNFRTRLWDERIVEEGGERSRRKSRA